MMIDEEATAYTSQKTKTADYHDLSITVRGPLFPIPVTGQDLFLAGFFTANLL